MASVAVCDGNLIQRNNGTVGCDVDWISAVHVPPFDASQIDPLLATQLFLGGFVMLVIPWGTAYGLSRLIKAIKKF